MSGSKGELDVAGLGRIAEAIPKEGWKKAIDTACDTFTDLIAPITKTTAGLGGLIQAKFDAMIDVQKVFAADTVYRARKKTEHIATKPNVRPSAKVLVSAIEQASTESDDSLRDIWANLIANEMVSGNVHPEFPATLARISANDAAVLSKVAEKNIKKSVKAYAASLSASVSIFGLSARVILAEDSDASHEHLERLVLIRRQNGIWNLTRFGEEFVRAVTEPGLAYEQNNDS